MSQTIFNPTEKNSDRILFPVKKKNLFTKIINAYGKIELLIFSVLLMVIVVLAVKHNLFD
ncbi:MAG: hypothetical protein WCI97_12185 [Bacteroidota bacterium]